MPRIFGARNDMRILERGGGTREGRVKTLPYGRSGGRGEGTEDERRSMELLQDNGHMYQDAFGAEDVATPAMRRAILKWFGLYYGRGDGLLQLPYTIVRKLSRAVMAEYAPEAALEALPAREAMELAMIGGECFIKPVAGDALRWRCISRGNILVFGRDLWGKPTDVGLIQKTREGKMCYTLLERRQLRVNGDLHITNRLFRASNPGQAGREVPLRSWIRTAQLPEKTVVPGMEGIGLAHVKMPMTNCVDGSRDGVSVFAPAVELMEAIAENEAQLIGEFRKGQSRLVVSRDMLDRGQLRDELFVALDESPDTVGITVFAPELREQSYLARQQSYLRLVENVIGLKRGLLSQVEAADRTATEITSSEGEYMTTIWELRKAWEAAAEEAMKIQAVLTGSQYRKPEIQWGDGIL